jgi:hypothetical protein
MACTFPPHARFHPKIHKTSKFDYSTTMAPIDDAVDDLNSQKTPRIAQTAKKYGVNRSTLSRRFHGITKPKAEAIEQQSLLTQQQQSTLVKYINTLSDDGIPPTNAMVRNFAEEIAKRRPGKNWVYRFVNAHSHQLKSGYLSAFDLSRKKADNIYDYELYFKLVCDLLIYITCTNIC